MNAAQLLSALNWCLAIVYGALGLLAFMPDWPLSTSIGLFVVAALLVAPHVYLGLTIDQGKGRELQTALAVLSLLNVPIGTVYGIFALYVCWASDHAAGFDPGEVVAEKAAAGQRDDAEAPEPADDGLTPYAFAQALQQRGLSAETIYRRLLARGLTDDEAETTLDAIAMQAGAPRRAPLRPVAKPRR